MPPKESRYPNDWLALAEKDLLRVTRSLRDKDPELAAFYLQQAVEKFLKAYLLSKGWKLRRIHDLEALSPLTKTDPFSLTKTNPAAAAGFSEGVAA